MLRKIETAPDAADTLPDNSFDPTGTTLPPGVVDCLGTSMKTSPWADADYLFIPRRSIRAAIEITMTGPPSRPTTNLPYLRIDKPTLRHLIAKPGSVPASYPQRRTTGIIWNITPTDGTT